VHAGVQESDRSLFKSSSMVSLEIAKKEMKQVYLESGQTKTLHCGCFFDKQKQVYPSICDQAPERRGGRRIKKILTWVHAAPPSFFAGSMNCWRRPVCTRLDGTAYGGADCCTTMSPKFKSMEADMHNLIPAIDMDEEVKESSSASAQFGGMTEYKFCTKENTEPTEPRPGAGGDLARAYFYMSYLYRIRIPSAMENRLRMWHLEDPPDAGEEKRNSLIEIVQGNRNPFIDHPEQVERVQDF
ncbi:MAG: endonuclease, partial [Nitrospinae bacterium]|nr:endonuclease [Nitrospinota bacterium]